MIPSAVRRFAARLRAFFQPDAAERELSREISAHLALLEDEYLRRGLTPERARAAARQALGGVDAAKERHRDARSFPWLEDLRRDIPCALRSLSRTPAFTIAAVVTLALGLGASTAIFSVAHAVLLKPLGYSPHADRLVLLRAYLPADPSRPGAPREALVRLNAAELAELRSRAFSVIDVGSAGRGFFGISGHEDGARLPASRVTASVFAMLGARPLLGRVFDAADELSEAETPIVLSYAAWQRYFAGDSSVLGRTVMLDSVLGTRTRRAHTVVGVMPPEFTYGQSTELWMPRTAPSLRDPLLARLADDVSAERALAELGSIVRDLLDHPPDARYELVWEADALVSAVRPALIALTVGVGLLLLIACVNVANLLLARTAARRREMAVRSALGASRGRLVRQALAESGVLTLLGAIPAALFAVGGIRLFHLLASASHHGRIDLPERQRLGGMFPRVDEIGVDGTWLIIMAATALAAALAIGIGPAIRASHSTRPDASGTTGRSRTGSLLVAVQVALTTVLLVGSALVINSFIRLLGVEPGYTASGVMTFQVSVPADRYPDARLVTFAEELSERLRALPGVRAAAYANQLPMVSLRDTGGGLWRAPAADRPPAPNGTDARLVSRDYFAVMGIPVLAGRGFEDRDGAGQPRVLLINRTLAVQDFPDEDPVGQIVYVGKDTEPWTIVGVTDDVRQFGLDLAPEPQFFVDLRQGTGGFPLFPVGAYYAVRTDLDTAALAAHLRTIVRELDPEAALFNVAPMDRLVSHTLAVPRMYSVLLGLFAAVGLTLALVGIYGVLAYTVLQRTREIGVRMALGARASQVLRQVMRQGLVLTTLGLAAGFAGAAGLSRFLESLLYEVTPLDPTTYGGVALVFLLAAALASLLPARRATKIDPAITLRCE
jgi:predicted permease